MTSSRAQSRSGARCRRSTETNVCSDPGGSWGCSAPQSRSASRSVETRCPRAASRISSTCFGRAPPRSRAPSVRTPSSTASTPNNRITGRSLRASCSLTRTVTRTGPGRSTFQSTLGAFCYSRSSIRLFAGDQRSEQPVGLVVQAGGEEQRVRARTRCRRGKAQSPESVDRDRAAAGTTELALELAAHRVVGVDPAVAEVADEDVAAEGAEGRGRERHRPGRVELASADETLEQIAVGGEDIDEAVTGPRVVVVLAGTLLSEGDVELAADIVDPERREPGRDRGVGEAVDEVEVAVEDVDRPEAEARRIDELSVRRRHEGEALVVGADVARTVGRGRTVDGDHGVSVVDVRVPAGDRSVLGREQEEGGAGLSVR